MQNLTKVSQYDLYFFSEDVLPNVLAASSLVDPMVRPSLGEGWSTRLATDIRAYRQAVELVIRELAETTDVLRRVEQLSRNVSQWRELGVGLARNAPAGRREVLLRAVGYGLGSPRSVKEMKDMLLTVKSRVEVHGEELMALGMARPLLELPGRVLRTLEHGAGEIAREKAEDALARANVKEFFGRVSTALTTVWRSAELMSLQSLLLAERDEASASDTERSKEEAATLGALVVHLEKALGEARVQAQTRAASEGLPAELVESSEEEAEVEVRENVG